MNRLFQKLATYPWRKFIPGILIGNGLGFFLVYESKKALTATDIISLIMQLLFCLSLFPLIAFFTLLCEDRCNGRLGYIPTLDADEECRNVTAKAARNPCISPAKTLMKIHVAETITLEISGVPLKVNVTIRRR